MTTPEATDTPTDPGTPAPPAFDANEFEKMIHERVNAERVEENLGALSWDEELEKIAEYHSEDMAERGYFAHESPEGNTYEDRYLRFGYECAIPTVNGSLNGGENIALNWYGEKGAPYVNEDVFTSTSALADAIVSNWMNTEGPRKKILTSQWKNEGIGVATTMTADGLKVYVTQNFC